MAALSHEKKQNLTRDLRDLAGRLERGSEVEQEKVLIRDIANALLDGVRATPMVKAMLNAYLK